MNKLKKILLYRTSKKEAEPTNENISVGELAMNANIDSPMIFLKSVSGDGNSRIEKFLPITDNIYSNSNYHTLSQKNINKKIDSVDKLKQSITVTGVNVGNLTNKTVLEEGQSIESILREMLMKRIDAKAVLPKVSISNSGTKTGTYEVGTTINPILTHSFTDGKFIGDTIDYDLNQAAGCLETNTEYHRNDAVLESNEDRYKIKEETVIYNCLTSYDADTVEVKDNLGGASEVKIDAGVATSNNIVFYGKRYIFAGGNKSKDFTPSSDSIRALSIKKFNNLTELKLEKGLSSVVISFPSSMGTLKKVMDLGSNTDITSAFKLGEEVIVKGAENEEGVNYKFYLLTSETEMTEINYKIEIGK